MNRTISFSMWCVLLMVFGVSCQGNFIANSVPSVTPEPPQNWWISWLDHPVCKPPCWQNITPGVTTKDDALQVLETAPELTITFKTNDAIQWKFNPKMDGESGWLETSQSGIVDALINTTDETLVLEKVIDSYGNPRFVNPFDCREGKCSTALVYPDLGMFLSVYIEDTNDDYRQLQFEILPDTVVNRIYFVEPGTMNSLTPPGELEILMDWEGYGIYSWSE